MSARRQLLLSLAIFAVTATAAQPNKVKFRVISTLNGYPQSIGITEASPSVFYSFSGSAISAFSITRDGKFTSLATFPNGYDIISIPATADNGQIYYAETSSGTGTVVSSVFSVGSKPGTEKVYQPQSITPRFTLNMPDGTLVGEGGSTTSGATYLISSDAQGNVTPIYQFANGDLPANTMAYATDGNFYGAASAYPGGNYSYIWRVTPAGAFTKLYNFPTNDFGNLSHFVGPVQASDGNLYGVTPYGGSEVGGSFYQMTLSGQYTLLYSFPNKGASAHPHGIIQASDGNFYAATLGVQGATQIIRLTPSGQFSVVHQMDLPRDGGCQCVLTQGSDGIIYGVAIDYGPTGNGTFFALDLGLPKPAPQALQFTPASGRAGKKVRIWGYNLLSATVQFNGIAATEVHSSGPNYVWATVPASATTGPITVTTPGGASTTTSSFTVQ
jgi:hypothetical protein